MTETQSYFIDLISLVPDNCVCFIQAPSIENEEFFRMMQPSALEYYNQIVLTPSNKLFLSHIVAEEGIQEYFQSLEIKFNDRLLFEGHDGMEIGAISKSLTLTKPFIENYVEKGLCTVSTEW